MKKDTGSILGKHINVNHENKVILGIDPGLQILGIGIVEIDLKIFTTIEINQKGQINAKTLIPLISQYTHLFLKIKSNREISEKLFFIYEKIDEIIVQYNPNLIVVEDSFVGFNKNSAIKLGLARGSILSAVGKHKKRIESISPKQIKMEVTQKGTSTKEEIEKFLQTNLENWQDTQNLDSTDALAAALCGIKFFL